MQNKVHATTAVCASDCVGVARARRVQKSAHSRPPHSDVPWAARGLGALVRQGEDACWRAHKEIVCGGLTRHSTGRQPALVARTAAKNAKERGGGRQHIKKGRNVRRALRKDKSKENGLTRIHQRQ